MLARSAGLNKGRETFLLDAMRIIHHMWNEIAVTTISPCLVKSTILTPKMIADILAEHASRTKCATSQETKYIV